ncbi:MAG: 30S ribosomal protein S12 methylthiotransferase RimO [Lachnospiraceae bacterium]|nr:30S ribosomal protein S12 methylthiotransferase RimO [Lachnospiraceae bacterium]
MKLHLISLGCDKNLVDSERLLSKYIDLGYEITDDEYEADVIIINTCAFIHDAKEESIETILDMARLKEEGNLKKLIVTGCLSERYKDEFSKELPEVDEIIPLKEISDSLEKRILSTPGHFAHLKIAEGCNKNCTYCVIPKIRGPYRSFPMESILNEAKALATRGVKELILVAQETTLYGIDLYKKKSLHILLQELSKIDGIEWIRIMYCYPEEIYDELINEIKSNPKVCHYLDMPIQHISDNILKKMGRRTTKKELIERISNLKKEIPDITLRTSLICGFPGETEEDHKELLSFIEDIKFDRLGAFTYSAEEDTVAYDMDDQVDEKIKKRYKREIMSLQKKIITAKNKALKGETIKCFIEGNLADTDTYVGRTYKDAPDIDGLIFINSKRTLVTGDFVSVRVTGAKDYDLLGEEI